MAFKIRSLSCIMCINIIIPGRHACRPFPDIITPRVAHRMRTGTGVAWVAHGMRTGTGVACGMRTGTGVAPNAHGADYFHFLHPIGLYILYTVWAD